MTQLFMRFYLGVLAVLFLAWSIYGYVFRARADADRARVVQLAHGSGLRSVARSLQAMGESDRDQALSRMRPEFRCPIEIRKLDELDSSARHALSLTNGVRFLRWDSNLEGVGVAIDAEHYLRMGPFPNYDLAAIEDSLCGWMREVARQMASDMGTGKENAEQWNTEQWMDAWQDSFELGVAVVPRGALTRAALDRLASGRDVVFYSTEPEQWYAATTLPERETLLRVGPFPNFQRMEQPAATTTLALVLLPAAAAIALLLRPVARQLRDVEIAAQSIARGDLSARVPERSMGAAAKPLAHAFNRMAERTEATLRSQRELLQAVSHELKTPLARLRFAMDLSASAKDDTQRLQRLQSMDHAVEDLDALVEELLDYVRMGSAESPTVVEAINVEELFRSCIAKFQPLHPNVSIELEQKNEDRTIELLADRQGVERVLGNLIGNAARYARQRVSLRVTTGPDHLVLEVEDDGPGIPMEDRQRAWEPFVRLTARDEASKRQPGAGVGLGLAIVKRIVERHGGSVELTSAPEGGCIARTRWQPDVVATCTDDESVRRWWNLVPKRRTPDRTPHRS
jgi:two-component system, OmpR family, sensor histidine kinase RstB